jgi:lipopolysaccharide exporter
MIGKRAVVYTYLDRYAGVVLSLVSSMALARILSPEEVGIASIAFAIVAITQTFRDMGVATYIQTTPDLTQAKFSACLGISLMLGTALSVLMFGVATFAESVFEDPRVRVALMILAANLLLIPAQSVAYALLVRRMRYGTMLAQGLSVTVFSCGAAILLALNGFSYLSGPLASLGASIVGMIAIWVLRERDMSMRPSLVGAKGVMSISLWPFASNLMQFASERAPEMFIARSLGFAASAFYEKAASGAEFGRRLALDGFSVLFVGTLRASQDDPAVFRDKAAAYVSVAVCVGFPVAMMLNQLADPLVHVLFGAKWTAAVPALEVMAFLVPLSCLTGAVSQILYMNNLYAQVARRTMLLRALTVAAIAVVASSGPVAVASVVVAAEAVVVAVLFTRARRFVSVRRAVSIGALSLPPTLAALVTAHFARDLAIASGFPTFVTLVVTGGVAAGVWVACMALVRHPLAAILFGAAPSMQLAAALRRRVPRFGRKA